MFKLLVEIDDNGGVNVTHDGTIDPVTLVGALRIVEHSVLVTADTMAAKAFMDSMGSESGEETPNKTETQAVEDNK